MTSVHELPISAIVVGERRREDYGDIDELAASIEKYDLLHPVVVDEQNTLVAGGRRLEACRQLGWTTVPVRRLGDLTDAERREIELEENVRRKDLTAYERAKVLGGLAETAGEVLRQQGFSVDSTKNPKGGRPEKPDARERVAERIGIPEPTVRQAERHVQTVDTLLPTTGQGWKQYHVLEARECLEKFPEPERLKAAALIDQPGIPPKKGLEILGNLAAMPEPDRGRILQLAESRDAQDRSLALTEAAKLPPMPDPGVALLHEALAVLRRAAKLTTDPELTERIRALEAGVRQLITTLQEEWRRG